MVNLLLQNHLLMNELFDGTKLPLTFSAGIDKRQVKRLIKVKTDLAYNYDICQGYLLSYVK